MATVHPDQFRARHSRHHSHYSWFLSVVFNVVTAIRLYRKPFRVEIPSEKSIFTIGDHFSDDDFDST